MPKKSVPFILLSYVLAFSIQSFAFGAAGDAELIRALENQRRVNFISASGLKVSKLLQDDTNGSPHQKFNVSLSNGKMILIVSNLDMCVHIPVHVGDSIGAAGQFIPTGKNSGLLHWVHADPKKQRPDGYIELNGQIYCK